MSVSWLNSEKMSVNTPDLYMVENKKDVRLLSEHSRKDFSQRAGFINKKDVSQLAKHREDVSQHAGFKYGEE